jgi:hypothetical protein
MLYLIPAPQKINEGEAISPMVLDLPGKVHDDDGIKILSSGNYPLSFVSRVRQELPDRMESYWLKIDSNGWFVAARTELGLIQGERTLNQIKLYVSDPDLKDPFLEVEIIDWPETEFRCFHLELRFGIPRFERLLEIIDLLASIKYNTLLIEYEDKFPFQDHPDLVSQNALSRAQLMKLLEYAKERRIVVIPLLQTLGHLEYVLKHDRYYHLREVREDDDIAQNSIRFDDESILHLDPGPSGSRQFNVIDEICVTNEEAIKLVEDLLDEIIISHQESPYIHIGCDEAWNFYHCSHCVGKYGPKGKNKLFIEHLNRMAQRVKNAGKKPIIWDDMLRDFSEDDYSMISKDIVVMCWVYFKSDFFAAEPLVATYQKHGLKVFGAPAAKCNERGGPQYQDIPNFSERKDNIDLWVKIARKHRVEGLVTTLWSAAAGTIAPPHPAFDTAWFPVFYAADLYWNAESPIDTFEARFIRLLFGTQTDESILLRPPSKTVTLLAGIKQKATRNNYLIELLILASLSSIYRMKSLNVHRDLYKLIRPITGKEKMIIFEKKNELMRLRDYIEPRLTNTLLIYYQKNEVEEFVASRFWIDKVIDNMSL